MMEGKQVVTVTPRTARRSFTKEFKRELVRQAMMPDVSRAALALANGVNANQLARWCREQQHAERATFIPVAITAPVVAAPRPHTPIVSGEIEWRHGNASMIVRGDVNPDMLRIVISETLTSSRAS